MAGMIAPGSLRGRNFRLLVACDVMSALGTGIAVVAAPFAVLAIGGSAADVGYVATAALLPMVAFLLLGGVVADRLPRHRVVFAAEVAQAVAQGLAAALLLAGAARVWELVALSVVRGAGLGFYFPAASGLLPQTVEPGDRAQANAIDRVGRNGAQIGGTALGGLLVGFAGPGWGLAADAASFIVAAALRLGMRFPAALPAGGTSMLAELREGWREFTSRRWLWSIVVQFAGVAAVITAATSVLGPLVAQDRLGGAKAWGAILAAFAVGAVVGGLIMVRYRPGRMLLAATGAVLVFTVLLFALAIPLTVPLIAAAALIAGAAQEVFAVSWATTLQQEIPPAALSRVSAYDAIGSFALAPVGTVVAGPLAVAFGAGTILLAGGTLVVALTVAVLLVPEVRQLRRQPPAPAGPARAAHETGR
jgi:MFS family permease